MFEPSPHSEFTGFDGQQHKAGTTGSPIRFGSAGGGAPACPGFLNWGQPFADLLLHPKIVPFLTEFLVSPQATKLIDPNLPPIGDHNCLQWTLSTHKICLGL